MHHYFRAPWNATLEATTALVLGLLLAVLFAAANIHGPFDILISSVLAATFSGIALQRLLGHAAIMPRSTRMVTRS